MQQANDPFQTKTLINSSGHILCVCVCVSVCI